MGVLRLGWRLLLHLFSRLSHFSKDFNSEWIQWTMDPCGSRWSSADFELLLLMQGSLAIPHFKTVIKITFFLLKLEGQTQHHPKSLGSGGKTFPTTSRILALSSWECGKVRGKFTLAVPGCSPGSPGAFLLSLSSFPALLSAHGGARCYPRLCIPSLPGGNNLQQNLFPGKSCPKAAALDVPCSKSTSADLISSSNKRAEEEI